MKQLPKLNHQALAAVSFIKMVPLFLAIGHQTEDLLLLPLYSSAAAAPSFQKEAIYKSCNIVFNLLAEKFYAECRPFALE